MKSEALHKELQTFIVNAAGGAVFVVIGGTSF